MRVLTCPASYSAIRRGTGNTPPIHNSGANLQLPCDVLQVDEISTDPVRQDRCEVGRVWIFLLRLWCARSAFSSSAVASISLMSSRREVGVTYASLLSDLTKSVGVSRRLSESLTKVSESH